MLRENLFLGIVSKNGNQLFDFDIQFSVLDIGNDDVSFDHDPQFEGLWYTPQEPNKSKDKFSGFCGKGQEVENWRTIFYMLVVDFISDYYREKNIYPSCIVFDVE